jgi:hypothetical protein
VPVTTIRKTCPSTGCTNPGDPLCHEHMRPYAQKVAEDLETQEKEIAKVKDGKWRAIDPEGPLCQEFMRIVRTAEAPPTLERINLLLFRAQAQGPRHGDDVPERSRVARGRGGEA